MPLADLLDVVAAINWADSQLPVLQERIIRWRQSGPYSVFIDTDSEPGKKLYRLVDVKPLDPIINAEVGAIIHSIRSSLDLLACALATRNGYPGSRSTHFPIWKTEADFLDIKSRPYEYIKRLSQVDQDIIKNLRPYPGGNDMLCTLHELDLTRKHRRLLNTIMIPRGIGFEGFAGHVVTIVDWHSFKEEAVVISTLADAPDGEISVTLHVAFDEPGMAQSPDITGPLRDFSRATFEIIRLFI